MAEPREIERSREDAVPAAPSPTTWYRAYWQRTRWPYSGCGCLYVLTALLIIIGMISLVFGTWPAS